MVAGRRELGKIVVVGGQISVLGSVASYFQTICEKRKTKENKLPKKGFNDEVGKKQADRKLSLPVMAKIICDRLPTFS